MDPMWLDRDFVDKVVEGIDASALMYDPDTGLYCQHGEPFTGVTKTRWWNGKLRAISHLKNGVAHGLAVVWHANGQIREYSEMADDVLHGWHTEWNEDGSQLVEEHYTEGVRDNRTR
jgi:hypothetical protein